MITDVLLDHAALVPTALLFLLLVCVGVGVLARRHGRRALWSLTALAVLPVLALTLVPSTKGRAGAGGCTVQFAVPTLHTLELLANVALFVPPVLFATLATRRPLAVLAAGTGLSVAVETLQALVPALGRACDTNDWAMNTAGAVVGVGLAGTAALLAERLPGQRLPDPRS